MDKVIRCTEDLEGLKLETRLVIARYVDRKEVINMKRI